MADVNVRFKADTSAVDKAKEKVDELGNAGKTAAQRITADMERMREATDKAGQEVDDLSRSTKSAEQGFSDLARTAEQAGDRMSKSVEKVNSQISAMRIAMGAARGANMIGGAMTELSDGRGALGLAGGALSGAGEGAQLGAALAGPLGAAAGALGGAAKGLLEAALKQKEAAQAAILSQRDAHKNIFQPAIDQAKADAAAKADAEDVETWREKGASNARAEYARREEEARKAREAVNAYATANLQSEGVPEEELNARQQRLSELMEEQRQAERAMANLAPLVAEFDAEADRQAAEAERAVEERRREAERVRREKERAEQEAAQEAERAAQEAARAEERAEKARKAETRKGLQGELKEAEAGLSGTQAELTGAMSTRIGVTDDLTSIGGGGGYASYNNSVADNIRTITARLQQIVVQQQQGVERITQAIHDLDTVSDGAEWQ